MSKLITYAAVIGITAFISPFEAEHEIVRNMLVQSEFAEIFVDTPIEVAKKRDLKWSYS